MAISVPSEESEEVPLASVSVLPDEDDDAEEEVRDGCVRVQKALL
jgi:hypothetical protein